MQQDFCWGLKQATGAECTLGSELGGREAAGGPTFPCTRASTRLPPAPRPQPLQTGIRLSPFGGFLSANDSDPVGSTTYLLEQLNK